MFGDRDRGAFLDLVVVVDSLELVSLDGDVDCERFPEVRRTTGSGCGSLRWPSPRITMELIGVWEE